MFCLRIDRVAMWLATIETSRIADSQARQMIELWQCEAADVLDRWFRGAAFVRPTEQPSFKVSDWLDLRRKHKDHEEAIGFLVNDFSTVKTETQELSKKLAAVTDFAQNLDAELHRNHPTAEQRAELVRAIGAACECRASERERLILEHVAKDGPATSLVRIGASARMNSSSAREHVERMQERAVLEFEQRDPTMKHLRNYFVIAEGLQGHAEDCEVERKLGEAALAKMLEMTSAAVHVVPPNIPHLPLPQVAEESGRSARDLLNDFISKTCFDNGLSYKDFYSQLYARLAIDGMECRHRTSKDRRVSKIDYCDAHGWCPRALEIAKTIDIKTVLREQRTVNA